MMSLPAESFGEQNKQGSGKWLGTPKGANHVTASGFSCRKAFVGTRRPISVLFGKNGLRNEPSQCARPAFKAPFSATTGWHLPKAFNESLLSGGCGCSHVYA